MKYYIGFLTQGLWSDFESISTLISRSNDLLINFGLGQTTNGLTNPSESEKARKDVIKTILRATSFLKISNVGTDNFSVWDSHIEFMFNINALVIQYPKLIQPIE